MADVFIIVSGDPTNCPNGSLVTGVNCHTAWSPTPSGCTTFTTPNWDTRWDDITYYSQSGA